MQERIKQARDRAGLSLRQAAHIIGVSHVTIDKWETEGPPEARIPAIAEAYGVSEHWIKTGKPAGDVSEIAAIVAAAPIFEEDRRKIMDLVESMRVAA